MHEITVLALISSMIVSKSVLVEATEGDHGFKLCIFYIPSDSTLWSITYRLKN